MKPPDSPGGRTNRRGVARALRLAAVAALGLSMAGCASRNVAPFEQGAYRYKFDIALTRGVGETGACAAAVSVTDTAAKRKIRIPLFTAPWGVTTERAADDSTYGARLSAVVSMSADGLSGQCRAALYRGETLLASREAAVPVRVSTRASQFEYR